MLLYIFKKKVIENLLDSRSERILALPHC